MKWKSIFLALLTMISPVNLSKCDEYYFLVENNIPSEVKIIYDGENFKENIEIRVQTLEETLYIYPKHDSGYDPNVYVYNFLNNGLEQIFYSVLSGGSGGYSFYEIFSIKDGKIKEIFNSDNFNPNIDAFYEGEKVVIDYQGELLYLDGSNSSCQEDCSLNISSVNTILPYYNIQLNKTFLMVLQKVFAGYSANNLGYISSLLEIDEDGYKIISFGTLSNFSY